MRQAIYSLVMSDSLLMSYLPGGLYDGFTVGRISRQNTPNAYVQTELTACGLLRFSDNNPAGPLVHSSRESFAFFLYDRAGYSRTSQAHDRLYILLHNQHILPLYSNLVGAWLVNHVASIRQQMDNELQAALEIIRFEALVLRA